ncbi:MAG: metallophosphoesterase, partial [Butyricicoccus sp.]
MIYCMSDIHGEIDRYHEMLNRIQFSEKDLLYIIGDVIDRGPGGIDIIKELMNTPNIILLLGNHE